MARLPKEDAAERRTAFLGFQVTPSERARIERRAASSGLHLSEWLRRVSLSDGKAPAPGARDPGALRALAGQFGKLGNNVNQLAHHANERGALPSEKVLADMAAHLRAAVEKVLAL